LSDIVDNIEAIDAFTAGMDFETFAADRKTVYAVVRALEMHATLIGSAIAAAGNI